MGKFELILIPSPGIGHLASTIGLAKLLVSRDERLSVTVLIIQTPPETNIKSYKDIFATDSISGLQFIELPRVESSAPNSVLSDEFMAAQKKPVRYAVEKIAESGKTRISGIIVDMFCTQIIDVANEFGIPSYVFFTSGAATLGLTLHLQNLRDEFSKDITEFKDSDVQLSVPTFVNPVPAKVLPSILLDKTGGGSARFLNMAKRIRETKGILINTFLELESHALKSLSDDENIPPVYSVGPIINFTKKGNNQEEDLIIKWLDNQPISSVVFLCFGSMGSFDNDEIKEIASALERSGHRFLWSLRKLSRKDKPSVSSDYENFEDVLPKGFLERISARGKVIGWSPQMEVLSHSAVGGFVSHCGWNSILESVWTGVPIATWPMYAEQQANAFQMIKELEMAVEIKMDYRKDFLTPKGKIVTTEEIENGIKILMDPENEIWKKVKQMKENSRMALEKGGSSYNSLGTFINEFMVNA
ncbi:hypothetical protein M9H77_08893 [Catharanthus roseus]|uniref:Uncharacterized protein n=1 Tax=Catharanthus roseus TaxID=4058 RepID=A0ACC0BZE7_CATRO|nr:hypothetical protein M9H77_08893 [Catharanthus roseus]